MTTELERLCSQYSFTPHYLTELELPEASGQAVALCHRNGAELYMLACESEDSAFSYCFATPPENDKGLAHIVEHAVFCGSRNYPLKEPFANLQKTSVCSFLNAMTYPDQTLYPAASAFTSDFLQLLRVYGDAVFFPLLEHQAIAQEGVRQGPTGLDGIVFNEMQGYYGDFEAYVADASLRYLFPRCLYPEGPGPAQKKSSYSHPNSFDAGGDPRAIAAIDCRNYHEIREFHKRYYQPHNCRIVLYGSIPEQHLEAILNYLDRELFAQIETDTATPSATRLSVMLELSPERQTCEPVQRHRVPTTQKQGLRSAMLCWILPPQQTVVESLNYRLLTELLLGHSGSVLELPLIQSGLGADLSLGSGLELDLKNPVLRVGLSAYKSRRIEDLQDIIVQALERFCRQAEACLPPESGSEVNGSSPERLWQGALNSLEYEECALGEHGGSEGDCALERCFQLARASHFYRSNEITGAASGATIAQRTFGSLLPLPDLVALRRAGLADFSRKVRQYTLENPHCFLQLFEEQETISPVAAPLALPFPEIQRLQQDFSAYQKRRDPPEHSSKIVGLGPEELGSLQDFLQCERHGLSQGSAEKASKQEKIRECIPIEFFSQVKHSAESVLQLDFYWEITSWKLEETLLLPLFIDLVDELGLAGQSYAEIAPLVSLHIGNWSSDLGAKIPFRISGNSAKLRRFVHMELCFLPQEWRKGLVLFWNLLAHGDWDDQEHLLELLQSRYYEKSQELCGSPLGYAICRAAYRLGQVSQASTNGLAAASIEQAQASEYWNGFRQVELLAGLVGKNSEAHRHRLREALRTVRQKLLQMPLFCALSAGQPYLEPLRQQISRHINQQVVAVVDARAAPEPQKPGIDLAAYAAEEFSSKFSLAQPRTRTAEGRENGKADRIEVWQGAISMGYLGIVLPVPLWNCEDILNPALHLLIRLLQNGPAWEKIRLQQGAYGVSIQMQNGFLVLASSQDPDALHSIQLFYESLADLRRQAAACTAIPRTGNPDHQDDSKKYQGEQLDTPQDFATAFEAAQVQCMAEKLKVPPICERARIQLHNYLLGLQHEDFVAWFERLRNLHVCDLVFAADFLLARWPQRASCIFTEAQLLTASKSSNLQALEVYELPQYIPESAQ